MRKILVILLCLICGQVWAQNLMRITLNDGTPIDLNVSNVKEMAFVTTKAINISGEWLQYVDQYGGVLECYDFKEDGTLYYKVFYINYPILNSEADYAYTIADQVITIINNGSPAVVFTIDKFDESRFSTTANTTFYKVQGVYNMKVSDKPITIGENGDIIKYVDKSFAEIENNQIKALKPGSSYALVEDKGTNSLKGYRIDIIESNEVVDFSLYFKKSRAEIEAEFGDPDQINPEKQTIVYSRTEIGGVPMLTFQFDDSFAHVISVHAYFNNNDDIQPYRTMIENNYILKNTYNSSKTYYDTEDPDLASVKITINEDPDLLSIDYTDLKTTPASVVDWTQYLKKTGEQIKAEFGNNPTITNDDEEEDYSYLYTKNIGDLKRLAFYFTKGFEKVTSIRATFNDASSMKEYCDAIAGKYILLSETETRKTYYDTDKASSASVRVVIQSSGSTHYITYTDMSE